MPSCPTLPNYRWDAGQVVFGRKYWCSCRRALGARRCPVGTGRRWRWRLGRRCWRCELGLRDGLCRCICLGRPPLLCASHLASCAGSGGAGLLELADWYRGCLGMGQSVGAGWPGALRQQPSTSMTMIAVGNASLAPLALAQSQSVQEQRSGKIQHRATKSKAACKQSGSAAFLISQ